MAGKHTQGLRAPLFSFNAKLAADCRQSAQLPAPAPGARYIAGVFKLNPCCVLVSVSVCALLLASTAATAAAPEPASSPASTPASSPVSTPASTPAAAPAQADPGTSELAESARVSMRAMARWLASGVDSWFGDRPFNDGGEVTEGRFSVSVLQRERAATDIDVRFNARFRLPNLEEKTYFFFGRDDPRDVINDKPGALSQQSQLLAQANAERRFFAGIGRSLTDQIDFRLGFRGGLKPYVQARYRTQWQFGDEGLAEFRQTVFWSVADRAGATTAFSYEHLLSSDVAARWLTSATITQASKAFEWSSLLGVYRSFGEQRLLSLEALVNGLQGSGVPATDYGLQMRWEQPVYRDWLLGGIVVGHFWPRPDAQTPRRGAWAVGATLKMHF